MADAWLCTLASSGERAEAGPWPSRENHHLVLTKRVPSCGFPTCSHLRAHTHAEKHPSLTPPPNRACVFLRLQPSSGSGRCFSHQACRQTLRRKLPAPLSLPHNCQRPSLSFPSLPNLNRTLALPQASRGSIRLCSAGASLFTSN